VRDDLMTIGTFSMMTGLSIPTLRHYDEIGVLRPAEVDPQTNYRRYRSSQVEVGRRVRLLREARLSTDDLAAAAAGDDADARAVLVRHRTELQARAAHIDALLDRLIDDPTGGHEPMQTATDFKLAAVNLGVDSDADLLIACEFWGKVLGTSLEDWGQGSRQVVLGEGDASGFLNIRVRGTEEPQFGHRAAFGLGVVGLDDAHARALAAGAVEHYPPSDGENMPRHSRFQDPVGNRVVLWEHAR
jgi:DNA-binding transcriptional MerR regulator